jgi:hypothetical protein
MHAHEKSDPAIVAGMTPNAAGEPWAFSPRACPVAGEPWAFSPRACPMGGEAEERRAGTKGNAGQHSTHRTPSRVRVTPGSCDPGGWSAYGKLREHNQGSGSPRFSTM